MIVDGQVQGGIAQGIGTALYEEIPYDEIGQPLATTFADYMVPCAPEIPTVRLAHIVTPALATEYGVKGLGEGGAIAPPAVIANAVADAFRDIGRSFNETPLTPRRVSEAIDARAARKGRRRHESGAVRLSPPEDRGGGERGAWPQAAPPRPPSRAASRCCRCSVCASHCRPVVDISRLDDLKAVTRDSRQASGSAR